MHTAIGTPTVTNDIPTNFFNLRTNKVVLAFIYNVNIILYKITQYLMIIIRVDSLNLKNNKPSIESLEKELFVKLNAPLITLSNIHNIL